MQHAPLITDQFIIPQTLKAKTKNKGYTQLPISRNKKFKEIAGKYRQETGPKAEQREERKGNRTRQNNKRTDRKRESNDNPDRGRHQKCPASLRPHFVHSPYIGYNGLRAAQHDRIDALQCEKVKTN